MQISEYRSHIYKKKKKNIYTKAGFLLFYMLGIPGSIGSICWIDPA